MKVSRLRGEFARTDRGSEPMRRKNKVYRANGLRGIHRRANNMETTYTTALSDQAQDGVQSAKEAGRDAATAGQNFLDDAKRSGRQTLESAKNYARDAVSATGQKVSDIKGKAADLKNQSGQYIADQPVRSVLMAAAGGAALTALFVAAMRRSRY